MEVAFAVTILTMAGAMLLPAARRYRDTAEARAARETVAALVSRARALAVASGAAELTLIPDSGVARLSVGDSLVRFESIGADERASVSSPGADGEIVLAFDALGLGRVASRTLTFRVGKAEARLIVSSYGRVRRQ